MALPPDVSERSPESVPLKSAPPELTETRLNRLGEGIGRVVYASEHWVVKRERTPAEVIALIVIWKLVRTFGHVLPRHFRERILEHPSRRIRFVRLLMQALVQSTPKSLWLNSHIGKVWRTYHRRSLRGERLAKARLRGTPLVPEHVTFPAVRVRLSGWPRWLTVSEATERVECTLYQRLSDLAQQGRFRELEDWLNRFLDLRQAGWQHGLFSVDAHLKNFGVTAGRVVLLDTGGLTDRWHEVESRLAFEDVIAQPHIQLGLGRLLGGRPDIAERFNARWKAIVNPHVVRGHWLGEAKPLTRHA
jgi:hypothetical protein